MQLFRLKKRAPTHPPSPFRDGDFVTKAVFRFVFHKDHESSDDATIARRQIATPSIAIKTKWPQVQSRICENANGSKCGCGHGAFVSEICLAVDHLWRYCSCLFLQRRSSRKVMSRSCYSFSSLALLVILSFLIRLVRVRPVTPLLSSQGVGVVRSLLPTSLFEHLSMGQAVNPPTQRDHTE